MANESNSKIAKSLGDKKFVLAAGALGVLFIIALIVVILLFGVLAGDPRGESVGPGP